MHRINMSLLPIALMAQLSAAGEGVKGWPAEVMEIEYKSSADNRMQPALFYSPKDEKEKPLLIALHTWSGNYVQAGGETLYARWCIDNGWVFMHPNFRGPNWTPEALGSELAVKDIVSAVEYARANYPIDVDRTYLVGVSGGGHAALLMAGRRPDLWAGVSAWCGISDIKAWHSECKKSGRGYWRHIEKACGGNPYKDDKAAAECVKRSPLTYLKDARSVNLDINHGIHDGASGSVPFRHSLYAFNAVALEKDRIPLQDIESFYKKREVPSHLKEEVTDPLYGKRQPVFRKTSGNARVTIFSGGHEIVHLAALTWLANQRKGRNAVWNIARTSE